MIKRLIKSLRNKPKSSRDTIAFVSASVVAGLVFTTWAYNLPAKYVAVDSSVSESQTASPGFSSFFGGIADQIEDLKETSESVDLNESDELDIDINQFLELERSSQESIKEEIVEPVLPVVPSTSSKEVRIGVAGSATSASSSETSN